ncbi:hypothetical protein WJX82_003336 [Trebouxia sp. C0006]
MSKEHENWKHAVAGTTAGLASVLALQPLDVVKTRLQVQDGIPGPLSAYRGTVHALNSIVKEEGWRALYSGLGPGLLGAGVLRDKSNLGPYKGFVHAVKQIAREEGIRGFYKGLLPSLFLVSHGAIQFMVYEELKALTAGAGEYAKDTGRSSLSVAQISVMGAISKLSASVVTYPSQVVRARLQQRQAHNRAVQYRDGLATLKLIIQREGTGGLYKGLVPNVLRVMPQSAITFLVYEKENFDLQIYDQLVQPDVYEAALAAHTQRNAGATVGAAAVSDSDGTTDSGAQSDPVPVQGQQQPADTASSKQLLTEVLQELQKGDSAPNAFAMTMLCCDPESQQKAASVALLAAAFDAFPDKDYCLLTLPPDSPELPLLATFTRLVPPPGSSLVEVLYLCHRFALLQDFQVQSATRAHVEGVEDLLTGVADMSTTMATFTSGMEASSPYVVCCQGQVIAEQFLLDILKRCSGHLLLYLLPLDQASIDVLRIFRQVAPRHRLQAAPASLQAEFALFAFWHEAPNRTPVNSHVVVAGASDCGLSVIESLLMHERLAFNALTLLAPGGLCNGQSAAMYKADLIARLFFGSARKGVFWVFQKTSFLGLPDPFQTLAAGQTMIAYLHVLLFSLPPASRH